MACNYDLCLCSIVFDVLCKKNFNLWFNTLVGIKKSFMNLTTTLTVERSFGKWYIAYPILDITWSSKDNNNCISFSWPSYITIVSSKKIFKYLNIFIFWIGLGHIANIPAIQCCLRTIGCKTKGCIFLSKSFIICYSIDANKCQYKKWHHNSH